MRLAGAMLLIALGLAPPAAAKPQVPREFVGIVPQGTLEARELDLMRGVVGTLRVPLYWHRVEPRPGEYEFGAIDELVGQAAERGIRVLPFVYGSPAWATRHEAWPPLGGVARTRWELLLRRLVGRYGPRGTFWEGRERRMPIRRWQVWNEPNFLLFWRPHPSPRGYARLLRSSARALRAADPGAVVVAAGVAPVEGGIEPWTFLRQMYRVPGVRRDFDVVALHPYAPYLNWVETQVKLVRAEMAAGGDARTPLQLTELGIASDSAYPNGFDKGPRGQASFVRRALRMSIENRRRWRLVGIDWFTWRDGPAADPHCVFCQYGGLFEAEGAPKPAWWAFRRVASRAIGVR